MPSLNKFPEESLLHVVPDPRGFANVSGRREDIPVGTIFYPITGVRLESDASLERKNRFVPPNERLESLPLGTPVRTVAIYLSQISINQAIPQNVALPIKFRIGFGSNSASSIIVPSVTFSVKNAAFTTDYSEFIIQVTGPIATQIEVWARVDPADVPVGTTLAGKMTLHLHMDNNPSSTGTILGPETT